MKCMSFDSLCFAFKVRSARRVRSITPSLAASSLTTIALQVLWCRHRKQDPDSLTTMARQDSGNEYDIPLIINQLVSLIDGDVMAPCWINKLVSSINRNATGLCCSRLISPTVQRTPNRIAGFIQSTQPNTYALDRGSKTTWIRVSWVLVFQSIFSCSVIN